MRVPQINIISFEDSQDRLKKSSSQKKQTPKEGNFMTFNKNEAPRRQESPETPSSFQLKNSKTLKVNYTK